MGFLSAGHLEKAVPHDSLVKCIFVITYPSPSGSGMSSRGEWIYCQGKAETSPGGLRTSPAALEPSVCTQRLIQVHINSAARTAIGRGLLLRSQP